MNKQNVRITKIGGHGSQDCLCTLVWCGSNAWDDSHTALHRELVWADTLEPTVARARRVWGTDREDVIHALKKARIPEYPLLGVWDPVTSTTGPSKGGAMGDIAYLEMSAVPSALPSLNHWEPNPLRPWERQKGFSQSLDAKLIILALMSKNWTQFCWG